MKNWLGLAALICFFVPSAVADVGIYNTVASTDTVIMVTLSSSTATPLFLETLQGATTGFYKIMAARKNFSVQDISTSSVSCQPCAVALSTTSFTPTSTCPTPSSTQGKLITSGLSWAPNLEATNSRGLYFVPFCLSLGTNVTAIVGIEQGASY